MDLALKGKIAAISGGSVGIGLAVAQALAAEGVNLALCARNEERLNAEAALIRDKFGVEVLATVCDVSKHADIEHWLQQIQSNFSGLDILINNAGTGSEEKIATSKDEDWQYYWDLHVMAAVRLARGVMPIMKERGGGVILHNSSICATQPLGYEPIYNTTKAALSMFSKCLADECIGSNIRVNTINPGLIMTPDWLSTAQKVAPSQGKTAEEYLDAIAKENTPIGRFATPEELAHFFVFLCSDKASYCVGSTYYVDGGWLKVVN